MKRFIFYIVALFSVITGCYGDDMFERPRVVSVTPERDITTVLPDARVVIAFSKKMDTVKTNTEFSLSSSSGSIDGYFSWNKEGKTLTFTPKTYMSMAEKYTIRITESAEDADGNDLDEEFLSTFYTGGDLGLPRVVSYTPAANSTGNPENSTVTIIFSESILMSSVYNGISVSPAVEGSFALSPDGTAVVFTPRYGFSFGVTYTVDVSGSVKDEAGNPLLAPVTFRFTVGDDFVKPLVSAYQNTIPALNLDENLIVNGAEKDRDITLDFSEEILTEELESSVSISPSVPFYISTSSVTTGGVTFTRGVINFTENLQCEETYTLRINSMVTDLQNNQLDHDYRFVFITDGAGSVTPAVTQIGDIDNGDNSIDGWAVGEIPVLDWEKSGLTGLYDDIGIDFTAVINPSTLVIQLELVAGQGGIPSLVNIDWPSSVSPQFTRVKFGLYQIVEGNTYRITVKGGRNGLKDSLGNYMKEDFVQLIRF